MARNSDIAELKPGVIPVRAPVPPGRVNGGFAATFALVAALAGLFIAAVLSVGHVLDLPVPCGASNGCATVAAHASSKVWGVPIAFFGIGAYLIQIVLIGRPVVGRTARRISVVLAGVGTVVSAGLLYHSHSVIRATCPWCVASALMMVTLLLVGLVLLRVDRSTSGPRPMVVWTLGVMTAIAIGAQAGRMERAASAPPIPHERLVDLPAGVLDDPLKSIGPAHSAVTVVVFADLLCPACRSVMASLLNYQQANSETVRLVYRHQPLWEIRGHESSKAAAALSEIAAESGKFWAFADAVHAAPQPMTREDYLHVMQRLSLDAETGETRLNDPADPAITRVLRDIALATALGIKATPTFLVVVGDRPPLSASQRSLPRILNSSVVISALANHRAVPNQR